MFCKRCGKELDPSYRVCPNCGTFVDGEPNINHDLTKDIVKKDEGSFWWFLLALVIPLAGFILFAVWNKETPKKAKSLLWGAIFGVIIDVLYYIIMAIVAANTPVVQPSIPPYYF